MHKSKYDHVHGVSKFNALTEIDLSQIVKTNVAPKWIIFQRE